MTNLFRAKKDARLSERVRNAQRGISISHYANLVIESPLPPERVKRIERITSEAMRKVRAKEAA